MWHIYTAKYKYALNQALWLNGYGQTVQVSYSQTVQIALFFFTIHEGQYQMTY